MTNTPNSAANKQKLAAGFNLASTGYDKPALRFLSATAKRLVELGQIYSGQTILDIATGTGTVAISAAQIVGSQGQVIGIDIAEEMLAQAQNKAKQAGLTNAQFQQGDAENLSFNDNTFDAVLGASCLHFLPDMLVALKEWQRVVKPGELVAFSSFGKGMNSPLRELLETRIQSYDVILPPSDLLHRLDTQEKCQEILQLAGFENIQIQTEQLGYYLNNVDEWWDIIWYSGYRNYVVQIEPERIAQFQTEHLVEVRNLATKEGIWLDVPVHFSWGYKAKCE